MLLLGSETLKNNYFNIILDTPEKKKQYFIRLYLNEANEKILYVHMPYCIRKCAYCVCQSVPNGTPEAIRSYYKNIIFPQINEYKDIFQLTKFDQVYFGGGTPTIAGADLLNELFDFIPDFENIPIKCIEASPETLSYEHLELFKKYRFRFLSIGLQSLSKKICKKQNRFYVSKEQLKSFSDTLRDTGIYFNYDLIAFMDKGDVRDIPDFENELNFLMAQCKPSSITIHQLFQSNFSCDRTKALIYALKRVIEQNPIYLCINSNLLDEDIYNDTVYQAEYRLVAEDKQFMHYMWNKYSSMPVKGYDILSLGYTNNFNTISNAGKLFYSPGEDKLKNVNYNSYIYEDFANIRKSKGL